MLGDATHKATHELATRGAWTDPIVAIATVMIAYVVSRHRELSDTDLALLIVAAVSAVMSLLEHRRVNREIARPSMLPLRRLLQRATRRWLDCMIGMGLLLLFWWILAAEYGRPEYEPFRDALRRVAPLVPVAAFAGILLTEWRIGGARDRGTPFADCVLTRAQGVARGLLGQALLIWLVRAVFLPLNVCALVRCIEYFRGREVLLLSSGGAVAHAALLVVIYAVLIAVIIPGYLFSSRLLDTHVRRVDTTLLGWTVTLICYRPLSLVVFDRWLDYRGSQQSTGTDLPWIEMTRGWPMMFVLAGAAIVIAELVHLWAEACFGLRSSNLSNRGIIAHGPYRFCKHPIYVSKCIGWFLLFLPFLKTTPGDAMRSLLLFTGVCAVYTARAYAEERLLSDDPTYVAYALRMDERSLFAPLGKHWPWLTFRHRMVRWQRGSNAPSMHRSSEI